MYQVSNIIASVATRKNTKKPPNMLHLNLCLEVKPNQKKKK